MKEEIISPLSDFAFAQIFGNQKNIDITGAFLKTLIDIPGADYDRLTVENSILKRFFRQDKMGIVDLKLNTKSVKVIHIELQVDKTSHLKNRILYYAARLIGDQLKWGDKYKKLHQVISIVICNHILLDEEKSYINRYELLNEENRSFTDMLQLIILELPKIPETADSGVWPWLRFFTCKRKEEYEMLAHQYPDLEKPVYCAKKMSLLEKWRDYQFHKNLWKEDARMRDLYVRTEGREEGLKTVARNALAEGLSPEFVQKITGLDMKTIQELNVS